MNPVLQFAASLVAVCLLVALTKWLGLGASGARLADEAMAREEARAGFPGFDPEAVGLAADGRAALLSDVAGRVLLLRGHGVHFAASLVGPGWTCTRQGEHLTLMPPERRGRPLALDLGPGTGPWHQRLVQVIGGQP